MNILKLFLKHNGILFYIFFIILVGGLVLLSQPKQINWEEEILKLQQYEYWVLDVYKEEVTKQGYEEVDYELNKIVQQLDELGLQYNYRVDLHGTVEKAIINKYSFYAKYYTVKVDKKTYVFKNKSLGEQFITEIKKYTKDNYKISTTTLLINKESSKTELDKVIKSKKAAYEKAKAEEEARKKAAAKKNKTSVRAKSGDKKVYQDYAHDLVLQYGWTENDFEALVKLWQKESGWNPYSKNKYSGAYGIPQALPGSKMASAGSDWATNYKTQIKWGLKYIKNRYGSPSKAWAHFQKKHWY